ncbi:TetR/AcrR family transcriptional regulator [Pararhizobium haloflavum]|uniref:TetR/AcrR family transcriptional regulator n=1 Tax=Pararhizobium haloflavum TaxID=2037914 RepID=UPI000C1A1708|nr:TetR/AcrR family transcriptional regulator C-terminal domain-containing protein [Pararhizobium haloflavum]
MIADETTDRAGEWTERQKAVLDVVLALLVEIGDAVTMTAVARRASCSKETLYKWFGDRDGLLSATVQWQASKVHVAAFDRNTLDAGSLEARLAEYAANWLRVISGERSIALNRVAISHAGAARSTLGDIVLRHGRFALGKRMMPVLEAGAEKGLIAFDDREEAFRTFFGLIARDVQIRLLLGDTLAMDEAAIIADAARATRQFLALYAPEARPVQTRPRLRTLT